MASLKKSLRPFLRAGDIVDIIAPSSPPQSGGWKKGLQILQSWGLQPRFPPRSIDPWLFHANTDGKRLFFLRKAFSAKDSSAVWMLRGGYGMQKPLPSFMRHCPQPNKLFIGYSDGSALHFYLNSCNKASLHGPLISELGDLSPPALKELQSALFGKTSALEFKGLRPLSPPPRLPRLGAVRAPVRGGNLSLLSSSVGTPYMPSFKSCFLFLEDIHEPERKIDRMLYHLLHAGVFKGVKALLLGSLPKSLLLQRVLKNFSKALSVPVISGLPCGHCMDARLLPFNIPSRLSFQRGRAFLTVPLRFSDAPPPKASVQ